MTLGDFERLTRFELTSQGFEGKNKGYKGEFEEDFSDSPFVIYVEVCGRVLSGLTGLALFCFTDADSLSNNCESPKRNPRRYDCLNVHG